MSRTREHATLGPRDRLTAGLLDRLRDGDDARSSAGLTLVELREHVLRDLSWLFNCTQLQASQRLDDWPEVQRSVVNYGVPGLSGRLVSGLDALNLEKALRKALVDFEPRILPHTLKVRLDLPDDLQHHNQVDLTIEGQLYAQPLPLELVVRTRIDLESGQVALFDESR